MRTSNYLLEPVRRARDEVEDLFYERPRRGIGGLILVVALVAIGIWAWPELHRTIRIHRM